MLNTFREYAQVRAYRHRVAGVGAARLIVLQLVAARLRLI